MVNFLTYETGFLEGGEIEWGSRGRGFESRQPDFLCVATLSEPRFVFGG
jgi:hypothetical protein